MSPSPAQPEARAVSVPVTVAVLATSALTVMANATIAPSLPGLRATFADAPHIELLSGLILTLPSIFVVLSAAFIGWVADRIERRLVLIVTMVLYALGGASGLVAETIPELLAGRALLGLGVAGTMTIAGAYAADLWQGVARERFMGWQSAAMSAGGIVFVLLGGLFAGFGWRWPFLIYLIALPLALYAWVVLRGLGREEAANAQAPREEADADFPWAQFAWLGPLAFLFMSIFYILPTRLPFRMLELGIDNPLLSGLALAMVTLASLPGAMNYGRIRQRVSAHGVFAWCFLCLAGGLAFLFAAFNFATIMAGTVLCGVAIGPLIPNFMAHFMRFAAPRQRGRAAGLMTMALFSGQFASPLLSGPAAAQTSIAGSFMIFATASLAIALLMGLAAGRSAMVEMPVR